MHTDRLLIVTVVLLGCGAPAESSTSKPPADRGTQTALTCTHVVEIASTTVQDPADLARIRSDCDASLGKLENRYEVLTACMLAAGSLEELDTCENPPPQYESVLRGLGPSPEEICAHVMEVMKREADSDAPPPSVDEEARFMGACVVEMERERPKLGPTEFRRQAMCVVAARTLDEMAKCDPEDAASQQ